MTEPITPQEVIEQRQVVIPDFVFEAFNYCIIKHFNGYYASFKQSEVHAEIKKRQKEVDPKDKRKPYEEHWLDVEPLYEKVGWKVEYDKPAYNEDYPATFKFTKLKTARVKA